MRPAGVSPLDQPVTSRAATGSRPEVGSSRKTSSWLVQQRAAQGQALAHALAVLGDAQLVLVSEAKINQLERLVTRGTPPAGATAKLSAK